MFENTVMLIHSNTEYDFILRICMERILRYFPEIKVCLSIDDKSSIVNYLKGRFEFYKIYEYPQGMPFGSRVLNLTDMIDEEYILFHCDNNILVDCVDKDLLSHFIKRMGEESIDQLRFNCGNKDRAVCWTSVKPDACGGLYEIDSGYFFSLQPALWKKKSFAAFFTLLRNASYGETEEKVGQDFVRENCKSYVFVDTLHKYDKNAVPGDIHEIYVSMYPAVHPFSKKKWIDDPENVYQLANRLSLFYKEKINDIRNEFTNNSPYLALRNKYRDTFIFHLSCIGYAINADFSIYFDYAEQRDIDLDTHYIASLKDNSTIFLYPHSFRFIEKVNECCNLLIQNNIKVNWYLVYEPFAPKELLTQLLSCAYNIFITNNLYEHPQIHQLPLGIRDGEEAIPHHRGFSHRILFDEAAKLVEKKYLCLLCYSDGQSPERVECTQQLGNAEFILNLNKNTYEKQPSVHCGKVPVWINYEKTHESYYTLSPAGVGRSTHRFFEAIYLRSIPIVVRSNTPFDKLYDIYPCLLVNSWNEITREFLETNLEPMTQKLNTFLETYPNFMTDISGLQEFMSQT